MYSMIKHDLIIIYPQKYRYLSLYEYINFFFYDFNQNFNYDRIYNIHTQINCLLQVIS